MIRKFHIPAIGGLAVTLGGIATAVVKYPELVASLPGKVGAVVVAIAAIAQAFTKPIPKDSK